jgi:hypothetical protein
MNAQPVEQQNKRQRTKLPVPGPWLGVVAAVVLGACTAILGIEEATLDTAGTGGQAATGGSAGTGGTGPECLGPTDCNDANPCTNDTCPDGSCAWTNVPNGPAPADLQTPGDCKQYVCTSGASHTQTDDTDVPVDGKECTADVCSGGTPSNPPVTNGTACTQNGGTLCYLGDCVECYDNTQCTLPETCFGGGTPFVCGCTPNACDALTCGFATDTKCGTGTLACSNSALDGTETDVDCGGLVHTQGGTCDLRCTDGKHCVNPSDCASNLCNCLHCGVDGCTVADAG